MSYAVSGEMAALVALGAWSTSHRPRSGMGKWVASYGRQWRQQCLEGDGSQVPGASVFVSQVLWAVPSCQAESSVPVVQGTAWAWLVGHSCTAWPSLVCEAVTFCAGVVGCLGSLRIGTGKSLYPLEKYEFQQWLHSQGSTKLQQPGLRGLGR